MPSASSIFRIFKKIIKCTLKMVVFSTLTILLPVSKGSDGNGVLKSKLFGLVMVKGQQHIQAGARV